MTSAIEINKSIAKDRWVEFCDQFADGNRGRRISIEVIGSELGNEELIHNAELMAMVCDPVGKGERLTIETGKDEVNYAHTIESPVEILTGQDANGIVQAVRITDVGGVQTLIKFPAN